MRITKLHITIVVAFSFQALGTRARAVELIDAIDWFQGAGASPCSAGAVQFYLGHETIPLQTLTMGQGSRFWLDGESGQFDFFSGVTPGFDEFTELITDGISNDLLLLTGMDQCIEGAGNIAPESFWFEGPTDLVGNELDFIRLIVHDVNIEEDGTNVIWQANLTYEFWGTPVPEPATAMLVLVTLPCLGRARRRIA